jgi:hypothetical protein
MGQNTLSNVGSPLLDLSLHLLLLIMMMIIITTAAAAIEI